MNNDLRNSPSPTVVKIIFVGLIVTATNVSAMPAQGNAVGQRSAMPICRKVDASTSSMRFLFAETRNHGNVSCEDLIESACLDAANREEGEQAPPAEVVAAIKTIIHGASAIRAVPIGDIAPYFGEISVTWRNTSRSKMLRLTALPNGTARLDYGTTPDGALGVYQFDANASGQLLAERLNELES